jgi:hypothetical protein
MCDYSHISYLEQIKDVYATYGCFLKVHPNINLEGFEINPMLVEYYTLRDLQEMVQKICTHIWSCM